MSSSAEILDRLLERIRSRSAPVCVIGQGYVGLPLAVELTAAGYPVIGLEADAVRAQRLLDGASYVGDISDARLREALDAGYTPTDDPAALAAAEVVLITVPTPYTKTKQPDLSYVRQAIAAVCDHLQPGRLIVLESTTYPGTTRELMIPALESTGMKLGVEFEVAYSPERLEPGNSSHGLRNTPKIVGGATPLATEMAAALYRSVVTEVVAVSSPDTAEMAKLLENTYRHVNIALANEMARICHELGVDVWEVIQAAASKPFGFQPFYPGPGVGGHCIPIDPYYLTWKAQEADQHAPLIAEAGRVNDGMPEWVVHRVGDALNRVGRSVARSRVLIVGVAYKANVGDVRESPALRVIERLHKKEAILRYHDPYVPEVQANGLQLSSVPLTEEEVRQADCVLILTGHRNVDYSLLARESRCILDTRNAMQAHNAPQVERL